MSEMIGNFFFLNHSYDRAVPILEQVIDSQPAHDKARKKLVIAYIETGRLRDAYNLYGEIIEQDPSIITSTIPEAEDCPCPELIEGILKNRRNFDDPANRLLVLGIYASYCRIEESVRYFKQYIGLSPNDKHAASIVERLQQNLGTNYAQ